MQLAPHLHRIGNDIVAAYLVDTPDGITVIDAGLPGLWRDLRVELRAMGKTLDDIRGIVLTHGDSDHLGFAERLRREKDIPVFVHAADADRARGAAKPKTPFGRMKLWPILGFFAYGLRKRGFRTTYLTKLTEVGDGDVLALPGSPHVIAMPGHSPGSIAIDVRAVDALFVGDALTTRSVLTGRTGLQPAPFTDDPAEALTSLRRLTGSDATWVLPGHGAPWRGSPERVDAAVRDAV